MTNRQMTHHLSWLRAVPMLSTRLAPNHIPCPQDNLLLASLLHPSCAREDAEELAGLAGEGVSAEGGG
jgi:hypothetical protein